MADDETTINLDNSAKEIGEALKDNIKNAPWAKGAVDPVMAEKDTARYTHQYYIALLNYKGAQLNKKATDRLKWATVALVFATIGLIVATLFGHQTVAPLVVKDGVKYDAKAFNWDKEKWLNVQVVFNEDEATISLSDETRTLFLVHPRKPKNPAKIEAIDEERDVHWDIKIVE